MTAVGAPALPPEDVELALLPPLPPLAPVDPEDVEPPIEDGNELLPEPLLAGVDKGVL